MPLDENTLIALLTKRWKYPATVHAGAGDDCAVVHTARPGIYQLLKTDAIVEGHHFTPDAAPQKIGHKAIARVLSDFAAMGGHPQFALVTLMLPKSFDVKRLRAVYAGMDKTAHRYGLTLVGGETVRAAQFALSIAATGFVHKKHLVRRDTARAGDLIFVTGTLGGSAAGKHLSFTPRLAESHWLVQNFKPTAMMDLSDGLAEDLPRLAAASHLSYQIELDYLPRSKGIGTARALTDGEDFELLFTISPRSRAALQGAWKKTFKNTALTYIGKMASISESPTQLQHGFDHIRHKQC